MILLHKDLLSIHYYKGCEVKQEVIIHPQRINDQMYYIAETTEDVDFEFKGKKLVKMWDVKEERTYYPDAIMKMVKDKDNLLHGLYENVTYMLDLYINKPSEYRRICTNTHRKNIYALNNIRKAENDLSKKTATIKRNCEKKPPYAYDRPTWPEYIAVPKGHNANGAQTMNDARKIGIQYVDQNYGAYQIYVDIYKKSSKMYTYVGSVIHSDVGRYDMVYFLNKNGAFQMNGDGSLAGALYRW